MFQSKMHSFVQETPKSGRTSSLLHLKFPLCFYVIVNLDLEGRDCFDVEMLETFILLM